MGTTCIPAEEGNTSSIPPARPLIAPLVPGPLDIIGDIHGEIDALDDLLGALGYNARGGHVQGRHLVFVGDLVDRGPDSPAVIERVAALVEQGVAQCILGNHELNLLRNAAKPGNAWIIHTHREEQRPGGEFAHSRRAPDSLRMRCLAFLNTLPLALTREDLRVVHAAWVPEHVARLEGQSGPVTEVYERYSAQVDGAMQADGLLQRAHLERKQWRTALHDPRAPPPLLRALGESGVRYQMGNPVRVLTSGVERLAAQPFWSSGTWRMCDRVPWWETYEEAPVVVIGHYWRRLRPGAGHLPDLFAGTGPFDWLGPRGNVFCIDYSVGGRYKERNRGRTVFDTQLCALRWPEREIWGEKGPLAAPEVATAAAS